MMMMTGARMGGIVGAMAGAAISPAIGQKDRLWTAGTRVENQGSGFIDCYFLRAGQVLQIGLWQAGINFSGPGPLMWTSAQGNFDRPIDVICHLYGDVRVDSGLVDLQTRQTPLTGAPAAGPGARLGWCTALAAPGARFPVDLLDGGRTPG